MKWLVTLLLSLYAAALSATTIEKINLDNHREQANLRALARRLAMHVSLCWMN